MKKTAKRLHQANEYNKIQIFGMSFKSKEQELAYRTWHRSTLTCLLGPAGSGKTYLGVQFAINEVIHGRADKIVITRPVVEAGEKLGYLPGSFEEKIHPYNLPIYDSIEKIVGKDGPQRDLINSSLEIAPLAYMRGRTFDRCVMLLDEAQNATAEQLKMFSTRVGENSKIIITGDPEQSDLPVRSRYLDLFVARIEGVEGVGVVEFDETSIVRHPIIAKLLRALE